MLYAKTVHAGALHLYRSGVLQLCKEIWNMPLDIVHNDTHERMSVYTIPMASVGQCNC